MDVNPWENPIKPFDVPDYAKQRRSSDDALKEMQQRLLRAVNQSIEDRKPKPPKPEQGSLRKIMGTNLAYDTKSNQVTWENGKLILMNTNASVHPATPAEEVSAKELEGLIYELRDEWSSEKGEWDGTKMPVTVLAEKIMKRIRAYKQPGWGK